MYIYVYIYIYIIERGNARAARATRSRNAHQLYPKLLEASLQVVAFHDQPATMPHPLSQAAGTSRAQAVLGAMIIAAAGPACHLSHHLCDHISVTPSLTSLMQAELEPQAVHKRMLTCTYSGSDMAKKKTSELFT